MEITTSWHRKGREVGRQEGRREGRREGVIMAQRKFISKFLNAQFGDASKDLQDKIQRETDVERLERLSDKLFVAKHVDEARSMVDEVLGQ